MENQQYYWINISLSPCDTFFALTCRMTLEEYLSAGFEAGLALNYR